MKSVQHVDIVIKEETINNDYVDIEIEPFATQCQDQQTASSIKVELDVASTSSTQLVDEATIKEEVEVDTTVFLPQCYTPGVLSNRSSMATARTSTAIPNTTVRPPPLTLDMEPSTTSASAEVCTQTHKSKADYMRRYRRHKREEQLRNRVEPRKVARNSTQRNRDFRARKKAKSILSSMSTADTSTAIPNTTVNDATVPPLLTFEVGLSTSSVSAYHIEPDVEIRPFEAEGSYYSGYGSMGYNAPCDDVTSNKKARKQSRYIDTGCGNEVSCDKCDYKCTLYSNLKKHMRTHSDKKPFACHLCSYKCRDKYGMIRHLRTHTGEKPFACHLCLYKSNRQSTLTVHMRTHTDEKPFACELCSFKCKRKSNLIVHMRIHTGEKPFICELCSFKCNQKNYLALHMHSHTGEKPFTCDLCSFKCKHKCNLVVHMRTHTGEKPYACYLCSYKSNQRSNLRVHMQTHTEEKPFACKLCSYKCKRKCSLERHIMHIHNVDP